MIPDRHLLVVASAASGAMVLGILGLWFRLSSGPIDLDVFIPSFTPLLASAIEENFGSSHHVEVGGTQIERTENGGTAVRIRDIVVRDADGTVVASAPKAEVRVSGMSLLSGHMRAESLNLVGVAMSVRIERDGDVTVFAGANKHPIATASTPTAPVSSHEKSTQPAPLITPPSDTLPGTVPSANVSRALPRPTSDVFAALLSWIDGIGETGLDGHELRELGLKNANLTVDDERTGKHWTFQDISLSVERPHGGGVQVTVGSDNPVRPWALTAAITPTRTGYRRIQLEARGVSARDLLLASRLNDGNVRTDMPLSASISGEIGPNGVPQTLTGRIVADAGSISDANDDDSRVAIDRAEFKLDWDAASRVLAVPFQILSGGNRITLMGQIEAPPEAGGAWLFKIGGGTVVLTPPARQANPWSLTASP